MIKRKKSNQLIKQYLAMIINGNIILQRINLITRVFYFYNDIFGAQLNFFISLKK